MWARLLSTQLKSKVQRWSAWLSLGASVIIAPWWGCGAPGASGAGGAWPSSVGRRGHLGGRDVRGVRHRLVPRALLVRPQTRQLRVRALTDVALVGPLAGVQSDVVAERGRLTEAAVAEAANEGLVQRVDAHVGAQVAAGVEAAVADDAAHPAGCDGGGGGGGGRARGEAVRGVRVIWKKKKRELSGRLSQPFVSDEYTWLFLFLLEKILILICKHLPVLLFFCSSSVPGTPGIPRNVF